jgi:hypothetical protein
MDVQKEAKFPMQDRSPNHQPILFNLSLFGLGFYGSWYIFTISPNFRYGRQLRSLYPAANWFCASNLRLSGSGHAFVAGLAKDYNPRFTQVLY